MKKIVFFIAITIISCSRATGQSCLPQGITFTSQAQINNFQANYPGCTIIEGNVTIQGDGISNLNGLSVLTSIGGYLGIFNNAILTNLIGLGNLASIGGSLLIGDYNTYGNPVLINLTGLENLTSVGGNIWVIGNNSLTSLTGLNNLTAIGGNLQIGGNDYNSGNPSLTNLSGLDNLTSIGGYLRIYFNQALNNLIGLESLTSIGGDLSISHCQALTSMTGLNNLTFIGGSFYVGLTYYGGNASLTSLTGLENLTSIGGSLRIEYNKNLTSLTGLAGLVAIGGDLRIYDNDALTSLTGLDNIAAGSMNNIEIRYNDSLSYCEVQSICDFLSFPIGTIIISQNAPGCNSPAEVLAACETLGVESAVQAEGFSFFPHPFDDQLTLKFCMNTTGMAVAEVFNTMGQRLAVLLNKKLPVGTHEISCNAGHLAAGIYFLRLQAGKDPAIRKIIKN